MNEKEFNCLKKIGDELQLIRENLDRICFRLESGDSSGSSQLNVSG